MHRAIRAVAAAQARRSFGSSAKRLFPVLYAKTHEWIDINGKNATVGISDFAQKELGDIVHVELPEVGRVLKAGEVFAALESVKATGECYAPVSGKVTEANKALADKPELLNKEPMKSGWICKLTDCSEPKGLMNEAEYARFCAEGGGH